MPSCPEENLLAAYLEGGLEPAVRSAIRMHIASCARASCKSAHDSDARWNTDPNPLSDPARASTGPAGASPADDLRWAAPRPTPAVRNLDGRVLCRRYLLERLLDSGAMGQVYVARDLRTKGPVAVKLLMEKWIENEDIYRRFREE